VAQELWALREQVFQAQHERSVEQEALGLPASAGEPTG
jgi:hypothetical protein